jgi:lactoylglutathione lyase
MKFKYTILYVLNVEETLSFYTQAFGFKQSMLHESGDYGELKTGATTLSFSSLELMTNIGKNPGQASSSSPVFEIAFETANVPLALEKALNAGAKLIQQTQEMPWGQTTAYVSDQNGFLIELCTPISTQS